MGLLDGTTQQSYYQGSDFGGYQFISLHDIIDNFMATYVGEEKILFKTNRSDVSFHAHRAVQELSFDTFKSCKAQEITVPASLQMILPQDYVNYTKISWVDSAGVKHLLYPTSKTSNPYKPQADTDGEFLFDSDGSLIKSGELLANGNFHGSSEPWVLNYTQYIDGSIAAQNSSTQPVSTSTAQNTLGDPEQGFFYGSDGNKLRAYDVVDNQGIMQKNVLIKAGEKYKITFTLSGYTSGEWRFWLVDENGDYTNTTDATADGTYSETLTAGENAGAYGPSMVMLRNIADTGLGNVTIDNISIVRVGDEETSTTWTNYKSGTPSENQDDYQDDTYWPMEGSRYGLDPQHAQANGSFYIDCNSGKIHFSSNISGKTVILDYISDSLGTDGEMQVHKFAEEAMYKWMSHAVLASKANTPEYLVARYKKERFAAIRTAKLRLSNIKLEEITQILRGKSKQIKH